jgi:hypothetical protein
MYKYYLALLVIFSSCILQANPFFSRLASSYTLSTPTVSYLKRYGKDLDNEYPKLKNYSSLINDVISNEQKHDATHYPFYHAQKLPVFFGNMFFTNLYNYYKKIDLKPISDSFLIMRNWLTAQKTIDANTFLNKRIIEDCDTINDHHPIYGKQMISLNASLLGNMLSDQGESTFAYFLENRNANDRFFIRDEIASLSSQLNYKTDFKNEYYNIINADHAKSKHGALIQLLVPKNRVDQYFYASKPFGKSLNECIHQESFDINKNRHTKLTPLLEQHKKGEIGGDYLEKLQVRGLFSQDFLLNPTSGVLMKIYSMFSKSQIEKYNEDIKKTIEANAPKN